MPVGVLFALSTRFCLEPDRGVILLLRNADTGDAKSSFWPFTPEPTALLAAESGRCVRRGKGVATVTVGCCCCCCGRLVAIFGVRGVLARLIAFAAAALRDGIWGWRGGAVFVFAAERILVGVA